MDELVGAGQQGPAPLNIASRWLSRLAPRASSALIRQASLQPFGGADLGVSLLVAVRLICDNRRRDDDARALGYA